MNEHQKFRHKVAIVTGAGTGIGFEIARQLVLQGATILLNDINEELTERVVCQLQELGPGKCLGIPGDAGSVTLVRQWVELAVDRYSQLDYLIANAGMTTFGDFLEITPEAFQQTIDLNLRGTFFLVQAAASRMRKQVEGGRIVLMSSNMSKQAIPALALYSMTKAAINQLIRSLVLELSKHGITINAIAPGATITERTALEAADYTGLWSRLNPNGRVAEPLDIANATLFLLSSEARHINGQTLVVDGGWSELGFYPES